MLRTLFHLALGLILAGCTITTRDNSVRYYEGTRTTNTTEQESVEPDGSLRITLRGRDEDEEADPAGAIDPTTRARAKGFLDQCKKYQPLAMQPLPRADIAKIKQLEAQSSALQGKDPNRELDIERAISRLLISNIEDSNKHVKKFRDASKQHYAAWLKKCGVSGEK